MYFILLLNINNNNYLIKLLNKKDRINFHFEKNAKKEKVLKNHITK